MSNPKLTTKNLSLANKAKNWKKTQAAQTSKKTSKMMFLIMILNLQTVKKDLSKISP